MVVAVLVRDQPGPASKTNKRVSPHTYFGMGNCETYQPKQATAIPIHPFTSQNGYL